MYSCNEQISHSLFFECVCRCVCVSVCWPICVCTYQYQHSVATCFSTKPRPQEESTGQGQHCVSQKKRCAWHHRTLTHTHTNTHTTHTHQTGNLGNHSQSRTECTLRRSSYFSPCTLNPSYMVRLKKFPKISELRCKLEGKLSSSSFMLLPICFTIVSVKP